MTKHSPIIEFKDRLRAVREGLRRMSQAELAKAAGLPASSIAHFEGGARKPSFDSLRKLASALNVTTDYLLGRVDVAEAPTANDPLSRYGARLSARDRALAEEILRLMADRASRERESGD